MFRIWVFFSFFFIANGDTAVNMRRKTLMVILYGGEDRRRDLHLNYYSLIVFVFFFVHTYMYRYNTLFVLYTSDVYSYYRRLCYSYTCVCVLRRRENFSALSDSEIRNPALIANPDNGFESKFRFLKRLIAYTPS